MRSDAEFLKIDALSVSIEVDGRDRQIIKEVTLSVRKGEAVALVGESGSGKSTTAKAIMRSLTAKATVGGTVHFEDQNVYDMSRSQLRKFHASDVSMIYQDPRAHTNPLRTVGDSVTEALIFANEMKRGEAEDRAVKLLEDVGIGDARRRLKQYPHELSGGLLQRVMIAAALVTDPSLLLADEPSTALDMTTQEEVMAIINEQRTDRNLTMILITHDLELAAAVTDRIAVMYAGVVVEVGGSAALQDSALHPYTAGLLISRPTGNRVVRLPTIPGSPVSAFEAGDGCVFASRCPYAQDRCRAEQPALRAVSDHEVACHRAEELDGNIEFKAVAAS